MESENTAVFDLDRVVAIRLNSPDGIKTVRVRFPSDDEWIGRQRRRKVVVKNLGRGMSETSVTGGEEVDAALLAKIRQDAPEDRVDVDPFEAQRIIEQLSQAEVDDVVPVGGSFRITTRVLGGTTTHLLKTPSAKDVFDYRRGFLRSIDLPYGKQEITVNLPAAGMLYKKLVEATEGYAGAVPIIHQAVAVKAAIDALDMALQEDREANF